MLKAVIFDMDGVIIDSEPMHARANVLALKKYNIDIPIEYCYGFIGSTTYYMCQKMIEDYKIDATAEELLEANNNMKKHLLQLEGHTVVPYVIDLIKNLHAHGVILAIASSSPVSAIEEVLHSLELKDYFTTYVSGMQVKYPKPAPDIFLKAIDVLDLKADECIIIEDSMNGVNAAKAAGIACIGYRNPNSGNQDLRNAAILVEGFDEIDYQFINDIYHRAYHIPKMIATSDRILLKELTSEDFHTLYEICTNENIFDKIDDMKEDYDNEFNKYTAYIKRVYSYYGFGLWGVYLKDSLSLIGRCGFDYKCNDGKDEYELGYLIDPKYEGQGYATESVKVTITYAFTTLKIPSLVAYIDKSNLRSIHIAEILGMKKVKECIHNHRACYKYSINNIFN